MIILLYRFDTSNVWRTILEGALGLNALLALGILFTLFVSREWTATVGLVLTELVVLGFTQVLLKAQEGVDWDPQCRRDVRHDRGRAPSPFRQSVPARYARARRRLRQDAVASGAGGPRDRVMERRAFLHGSLVALAAPFAAEGQQAVPHVGVLAATSAEDLPQSEGLRHGLRERGYVEGQNIVIQYRWARGNFERLPDLAAELVRLNPAVIVAFVTQASLAATKATTTIPIVMVGVGDPIGAGLVGSLARPGGNVTGNSSVSVEVVGKSLEILKEVAPERRRVSILWNPANAVFQTRMVQEAEAASRCLGLQVRTIAASDASAIDKAFQLMTRERAKAAGRPQRPDLRRRADPDRHAGRKGSSAFGERAQGVRGCRRSCGVRS